jgi:hypothetical protein
MNDRQWSRRSVLAGMGAVTGAGCLDIERTPAMSPHDWPMADGGPERRAYALAAEPPTRGPSVAWRTPIRERDVPGYYPRSVVRNGGLYVELNDVVAGVDLERPEASAERTSIRGIGSPALTSSRVYRDGMLLV